MERGGLCFYFQVTHFTCAWHVACWSLTGKLGRDAAVALVFFKAGASLVSL